MILTTKGFDVLRAELLGKLSTDQVNGLNFLVSKMEQAGFTYPEAAYGLATAYVETAKTFQPIVEYGSMKYFEKYDVGNLAKRLGNTPELDGDGYKYRGRGYVQITGTDNYIKFKKLLNVDLVNNPGLALNHDVAASILTYGMLNGSFTGVGFRNKRPVGRYDRNAYVRARAIINGTDRAGEIADYAMIFEKALRSP